MIIETWIIFLTAALALAFAPGPGMLYVLSRTISGGRPAGVASAMGTAVGGMLHVVGAALGISAILATSALAFTLIKWLGAIFLVYLGIKMIRSALKSEGSIELASVSESPSLDHAFYHGIIAEALNPKTAIFFLAFIPQFIQLDQGPVFLQFIILGAVVVMLNTIPDLLIAYFSSPIERMWNQNKRFRTGQQVVSGMCLVGLGTYLALAENKVSAKSL